MVVCKFFLKGNCKFGDRCHYEHVRPERGSRNNYGQNQNSYGNRSYEKPSNFQNRGDGSNNYSSPFNQKPQQTSNFQQREKNDRYHWTPPASNRYAPLNDFKNDAPMGSSNDGSDDQAVIRSVPDDINIWAAAHMWPYSCYSVGKNKRCVEGLADIQSEELRTLFYLHGAEAYRNIMREVDAMYSSRKQELLQMSEQTKASVLSAAHSNSETNPSSCLSILPMYGPGQDFKSDASTSQPLPQSSAPPSFPQTVSFADPSPLSGFFGAKPQEAQPESIEAQKTTPEPQSSKPLSLFKSESSFPQTSTSSQDQIYTDEAILTKAEIAEFKADSFTLDKIPMRPPPKSYCR